ncbi:hypothetical protein NC651_024455 [Populus alba x Populus x berolinensis]|nr:hypothetical protein NC651_024455 [Populus alba x Populus x berolinensis]
MYMVRLCRHRSSPTKKILRIALLMLLNIHGFDHIYLHDL